MDKSTDPGQGGHSDPAQESEMNHDPAQESETNPESSNRQYHPSSSSSTTTEDNYTQSPIPKDRNESSPTILSPGKTHEPKDYHHDQQVPHDRHLSVPLAESRPSVPQVNRFDTSGGLVDSFESPQSQSYAHGRFAQGEFGFDQLQRGSHDSRRSTLAQLSAVAQFDAAATSYENYDNSRGLNPTGIGEMVQGRRDYAEVYFPGRVEKERGWKRKRKRRSKGKQAERWDAMFSRLVEFKRIYGHCLVPNRYIQDPSLGAWVSTQRRHYKVLTTMSEGGVYRGARTPLTPDRVSRLEELGFAWTTSDPRRVPWETRFQQLLEYKAEHGDCVVPIGWKENPRLSNWVSAQRQEYKLYRQGKKCRIDEQKINALNAVGFVWEAQRGNPKKAGQGKTLTEVEAEQTFASMKGIDEKLNKNANSLAFPAYNLSGNDMAFRASNTSPQVLALLVAAQQQANGLQEQQEASSASAADSANANSDLYAQQQSSKLPNTHASVMSTNASRPLISSPDGSIRSPTQPSQVLLNHAVNQRQRLAAAALDNQSRRMAADQQHALSPLQEAIITKHVRYALRNEPDLDERGLDLAIGRILGLIRAAGPVTPQLTVTSPLQQKREHTRRVPAASQFPSVPSRKATTFEHTGASTDRNEMSKFGVTKQIGEVGANNNVLQREGTKKIAIDLTGDDEEESDERSFGPDDRKLPARKDNTSSKGRMAAFMGPRRPIRDFTTPASSMRVTPKQSYIMPSSLYHEEDDEGVFSDADEENEARPQARL